MHSIEANQGLIIFLFKEKILWSYKEEQRKYPDFLSHGKDESYSTN
jgi:hypothetical protein